MSLSPAQILRGLVIFVALVAWAWIAHSNTSATRLASHGATLMGITPLAIALGLMVWRIPHSALKIIGLGVMAGLLAWSWPLMRQNAHFLYFLQHAGTNLVLAAFFGRTLSDPGDALITRVARIVRKGCLSPLQERHTRQSTLAWTLFFLANAAISASLYLLAPLELWSTFANLFSLPLLVAMFAAEYIWRRIVLPPEDRPSIAHVIQAYRLSQQRPPQRSSDLPS